MFDSRELSHKVAIVGAAETNEVGVLPDRSQVQLHAEAAFNALDDAGLTLDDIDGYAGIAGAGVTEYLGIMPRWIDATGVGGCSFLIHVSHAVAAIAAGYCDTVLITHGESGRSRVGTARPGPAPQTTSGQFAQPFGIAGPATMFSVPIARHMATYGTTEEHLAAVSVATRQWAERNPRAMMRDPITIEDVLQSRMIAWPLHLLNCCLVTDGGGALILTSEERARDLPKKPVYVLGRGEAAQHQDISQMWDFTEWTAAAQITGPEAFRMAGLGHADIDHLMLYDAFSHTPIYAMEALGFVGPGEGGPWFAEMNSAPGGTLPVNTNGGGLSYTHTGMYGMFAIQEAIRQLRGEAAAQVDGVKTSLVHAPGGMFSATATLILGNE